MNTNNKNYEKIKKRFALNNSYFKNRRPQDPSTPREVLEYLNQHGELPYKKEVSDNWIYECYVEYQKRAGVQLDQFFTPIDGAEQVGQLANKFFKDEPFVLDAFCGFGMLSKALKNHGFIVNGFDIDTDICELYNENTSNIIERTDFREYNRKHKYIVSNPPFSSGTMQVEVLQKLYELLEPQGIIILVLPQGFMYKTRPKSLVNIIDKFKILCCDPLKGEFERTKVLCDIYVCKKI